MAIVHRLFGVRDVTNVIIAFAGNTSKLRRVSRIFYLLSSHATSVVYHVHRGQVTSVFVDWLVLHGYCIPSVCRIQEVHSITQPSSGAFIHETIVDRFPRRGCSLPGCTDLTVSGSVGFVYSVIFIIDPHMCELSSLCIQSDRHATEPSVDAICVHRGAAEQRAFRFRALKSIVIHIYSHEIESYMYYIRRCANTETLEIKCYGTCYDRRSSEFTGSLLCSTWCMRSLVRVSITHRGWQVTDEKLRCMATAIKSLRSLVVIHARGTFVYMVED